MSAFPGLLRAFFGGIGAWLSKVDRGMITLVREHPVNAARIFEAVLIALLVQIFVLLFRSRRLRLLERLKVLMHKGWFWAVLIVLVVVIIAVKVWFGLLGIG